MIARTLFAAFFVGFFATNAFPGEAVPSEAPDFQSDVRPILSTHCFACHGPDEHDRQAGLRLDTEEGIQTVIEAGDVEASELIRRLSSSDPDELMPPPEYNKPLSEGQKKTLESWVAGGGGFQGHWAFEPPVKQEIPRSASHPIDFFIDRKAKSKGLELNGVADDSALLRRVCLDLTGLPPSRDQIERFSAGRLDYEHLVDELLASPAFGQHFGRYWLDLVRYADTHGLHLDNYREMWPYRDWVIDAFNQNMPFDQFLTEQLAGDLLPDPTLEQKVASGFNRLNVTTNEGGSIYDEVFARNVIDRTDAFGTVFLGMTTQCAVCHDHKFDPISQKEYYSLFAFFNSLDGRALDENRKDPAPVVRVPTRDQNEKLEALDQQIAELKEEMRQPIPTVDAAQAAWEASLAERQPSSESDRRASIVPTSVVADAGTELLIRDDAVVIGETVADRDTHTIVAPLEEQLKGGRWRTLELAVLPHPETQRAGVSPNGNAVLTEIRIETRSSDSSNDDVWDALPIEAALADIEQQDGNFSVSLAIDQRVHGTEGWAIAGHQQKGGRTAWFTVPELADRVERGDDQIRIRLEYQSQYAKHQFYGVRLAISESPAQVPPQDQIEVGVPHWVGPFPVESANPGVYRSFASQQSEFKADETFNYQDQVFRWKRMDDWSPVAVQELPVAGDSVAVNLIHLTLDAPKKQSVDLLLGTSDSHVVYLNKKRIALDESRGPIQPLGKSYPLELNQGSNDLYIKTISSSRPAQIAYAFRSPAIALPEAIIELVRQDPAERTPEQAESLRSYYRQVQCDHPDLLALVDLMKGAEARKEEIRSDVATTLVWKELDQPREAKVLIRGQYDAPGETVSRGVPSFLPPMDDRLSRDRLGLAKWLVAPEHPLTARVAVNRFWQSIFGAGIVRSSEDFGSQGEPPSHPELLDYLAVDFVEHGWDIKRIIRLMVTSDAYRRDASISESQLAIDPNNRWLARGPRHRLDGEVLRDQALAYADLLNPRLGGPSVKPPQPEGLWYAVGYTRSNTANFKADPEPDKRLRRSVYIFWKRTSPPPQMSTFDAPSRESCTARRERTNTPLQALLLMNEQQYLKASKHLAARVFRECDAEDAAGRLGWLFETVTARRASEQEIGELSALLNELLEHYRGNTDAAEELLAVDSTPSDPVATPEHAAWMMIASTLLNLDEVVNN